MHPFERERRRFWILLHPVARESKKILQNTQCGSGTDFFQKPDNAKVLWDVDGESPDPFKFKN
jgi:hypothetical protein